MSACPHSSHLNKKKWGFICFSPPFPFFDLYSSSLSPGARPPLRGILSSFSLSPSLSSASARSSLLNAPREFAFALLSLLSLSFRRPVSTVALPRSPLRSPFRFRVHAHASPALRFHSSQSRSRSTPSLARFDGFRSSSAVDFARIVFASAAFCFAFPPVPFDVLS